jgi:hypothetical protein
MDIGRQGMYLEVFNNTMYIMQMRNRFKWMGKDPTTIINNSNDGSKESEEMRNVREIANKALAEKHK